MPLLSLRALVVVALLGMSAAVGYVFAPVEQSEFTFEYRPVRDASVDGDLPNPAVSSLALARSVPDELRVTLPCEVPGPASSFSSMHLGLWRSADGESRSAMLFPDLGDSLRITVSEGVVTVMVGLDEILRVSAEPVSGCVADVHYQEGVWLAAVGGDRVTARGEGPRFAEAAFAGPAASSASSSLPRRRETTERLRQQRASVGARSTARRRCVAALGKSPSLAILPLPWTCTAREN